MAPTRTPLEGFALFCVCVCVSAHATCVASVDAILLILERLSWLWRRRRRRRRCLWLAIVRLRLPRPHGHYWPRARAHRLSRQTARECVLCARADGCVFRYVRTCVRACVQASARFDTRTQPPAMTGAQVAHTRWRQANRTKTVGASPCGLIDTRSAECIWLRRSDCALTNNMIDRFRHRRTHTHTHTGMHKHKCAPSRG